MSSKSQSLTEACFLREFAGLSGLRCHASNYGIESRQQRLLFLRKWFSKDPQKAPRRLPEAPRKLSADPQKAPRSFLKAPRSSQKALKRPPEGSQRALKRLSEGSQKLPEAEFNSRPQGLAKAESCWDFTCRPKGSQIAEICLQKAPGQDLAQKGGNFRACPKP